MSYRRRTTTTATSVDIIPMDCLVPKKTRKEQRSQVFEETVKRIFWDVMEENNLRLEVCSRGNEG